MVSSAVRSFTPWLQPGAVGSPGATAATLSNTVCRMAPLPIERPILGGTAAEALAQLVGQSIALRSPTGGWPAHLPQTADNLALYLSEETAELLESLDTAPPLPPPAPRLLPLPALVPHLLWLLASSGYEIMRLIEGVKAQVYRPEAQGAVQIVRLLPVLMLTVDGTDYALDLVTQTDPVPSLYLPEGTQIRLLENDLDSQPVLCENLLEQIVDLIRYTQPGLSALLGDHYPVDTLRPFQPWQPGCLRLHLHLAEMEAQLQSQPYNGPREEVADLPHLSSESGQSTEAAAAGFTLDDFASTLVDSPDDATAGVLGDWLTFTDELWIQIFLTAYAQQLIAQHLPQLIPNGESNLAMEQLSRREDLCHRVTHTATDLVRGANGLFKHTFVHEPVLVADVWPRLRWYLAQSSERVMQLMGGVSAQVLPPGLGWQQGSLYLRPLMQLTTPKRSWIIDLSRGRLLPSTPQALPSDAAVDVADTPWTSPLTIAELTALVEQDLTAFTPALASLRQGTPIHLHRLDAAEAGCQVGQLTLDWCFTLQTTL